MVYWIAVLTLDIYSETILRDEFGDIMLFSSSGKAREAAIKEWGRENESAIDYHKATLYD